MKISREEYTEFEKYYIMEILRNPDYRLGQAFINYFPAVTRKMTDQESTMLFYIVDNSDAQLWIDQHLAGE
jgi:hypothetical protein